MKTLKLLSNFFIIVFLCSFFVKKAISNEPVDIWNIEKKANVIDEKVIENKLIRLKAEMKVPGKAWLQYEIVENENNCQLTQTAFFAPKGLFGLIYWYSLFPVHIFIFRGMIKAIRNRVLKQY